MKNQFQPPIAEDFIESVSSSLQDTLVDLVNLSLISKQAHWNVVGPFFRSLHEQFDELYASVQGHSDVVAERITALGRYPNGQLSDLGYSTLTELEKGALSDVEVLNDMILRVHQVVTLCRSRMAEIEPLDAISADILLRITEDLEKQLWMLRSQLA